MNFEPGKAIFLQIANLICENVLRKKWAEDDRIPSVRDMAVSMEVNPNTMMRAYTYLQERGVIVNKRGIGYFIAGNAYETVITLKRAEFMQRDVPRLLRDMDMLGIKMSELKEMHKKYLGEKDEKE